MTSRDTPGPTASLGNFIASTTRTGVSTEVLDKAAFCLLDSIGLAALAHDDETYMATRELICPLPAGQPNTASVWEDGTTVPASEAALVNAIAVHAQFHDDSDNDSWTHPGSFVIPAAVASAETVGLPFDRLLTAIAIGYATAGWLGADEVVARALIEQGIRTSPTFGTIAAAAAAASALSLDAQAATSAVGMTACFTGGLLEPVRSGSDEWRVQNAHASRGGLLAAQLAAKGVRGSPEGLEGDKGLLRALAGLRELPERWQRPPETEAILKICAKPWATLGDNMSVVLAAQILREEIPDPSAIRRIVVKVWRHYAEYPGTDYAGPFDAVGQSLASMRFATAAMFAHGSLEYDMATDHRQDPEILKLVPLVEIAPDDDGGPYDATVTVTLEDGRDVARDAHDAPRTLLFHDRPTSKALIERRLTRAGRAAGKGEALADFVFGAIDSGTTQGTDDFLNRLIQ